MEVELSKVKDGRMQPLERHTGTKSVIGYIGDAPAFIIAEYAGVVTVILKDDDAFEYMLKLIKG